VYDWTAFNGASVSIQATQCQPGANAQKNLIFRELNSYVRFNLLLDPRGGPPNATVLLRVQTGPKKEMTTAETDTSLDASGYNTVFVAALSCASVSVTVTPLPFTEKDQVSLSQDVSVATRGTAGWCAASIYKSIKFDSVNTYFGYIPLIMSSVDIYNVDGTLYQLSAPPTNTQSTQYVKLCNSALSNFGQIFCRRYPRVHADMTIPYATASDTNLEEFVSGGSDALSPGRCIEYHFGKPWTANMHRELGAPADLGVEDFRCFGQSGDTLEMNVCVQGTLTGQGW
jgi:hypothetical protein